jgi:hypothetical protein
MNRKSLSLWGHQAQLRLLRLVTVTLSLVDRLLNVQWGKRFLDRLADRWQVRAAELDQALARLEEERARLRAQAEALSIHAAAIYLGSRTLAHNELRFDPSDPRDEEMLNASIDLLVKERLASIRTEETEPACYVYHLEPDWVAIRARLSTAAKHAEPEIAEWFREGSSFIDEAFLSGPIV